MIAGSFTNITDEKDFYFSTLDAPATVRFEASTSPTTSDGTGASTEDPDAKNNTNIDRIFFINVEGFGTVGNPGEFAYGLVVTVRQVSLALLLCPF